MGPGRSRISRRGPGEETERRDQVREAGQAEGARGGSRKQRPGKTRNQEEES